MSFIRDDLLDKVQQLTDLERECLAVMGAHNESCTRTQLAEWLRDAGVREPGAPKRPSKRGASPQTSLGRAVSTSRLQTLVQEWMGHGLVHPVELPYRSDELYQCNPIVADAVLSDARLQQGCLASVEQSVRTILDNLYSSRHRGWKDWVVLARLALYRGDGQMAAGCFERAHQFSSVERDHSQLDLFTSWVHPRAPRRTLERIPSEWRIPYVRVHAHTHLQSLTAMPDELLDVAWEWAEEHTALRPPLLTLRALAGDASEWERAMGDDGTPDGLSALAVAALARGDIPAARTRTRRAVEASRGPKGRRKPSLDGPLASTLMMLLATGDTDCKGGAREVLARLAKKPQEKGRYVVAELLLKGSDLDHGVLSYTSGLPLLELELLLAGAFIHPGEHKGAHLRAKQLEANFARDGMQTLSREAGRLAQRFDTGGASHAEGWLTMSAVKSDWERALEALEALPLEANRGSAKQATEDGPSERLAFVMKLVPRIAGYEDDDWEDWEDLPPRPDSSVPLRPLLQPKVQRRQKKGWTKGSAVSLRKLMETSAEARYLTEADQRVLGRVATRRNRSGGREYYFSSRAALGLVGHPRVFWAHDPAGAPVEVVRGEATLVVDRTKDGALYMRLEPQVDNSGIGVRCDAEGRLVVLELTPSQQGVQRGLDNVPPVPPEGEARLRQTLDKLSQAFTLHSAIGAEGLGHAAREVPADARPVVQLTRANPGLRVRIRVQPLGTGGPGFIAGEGPLAVAADVDGEPVRCTRDHDAERRALAGLLEAIPPLQVASQGTPWDVDRLEACLELLAALRDLDDQVVVVWVEGTPLELTPVDDLSSLRLQVGEQGQWLSVQGELRVNESEVLSLQQALSKRLGGGGFVALDDNHFIALGNALQRHLQALSAAAGDARGGKTGRDALKLPPASLGFVQPWLKDLSNLKADARVKKRLEAIDRAYKSQPKVPRTLDAELRTYQQQGFEFMARVAEFGAGACLADDMGLGKTLMSLALLLHRAEQGPALVVAPTSVRGNWFDEALRFTPALRLREPPASDGNTWTDLESFDVVVASYTVLAHRIETLEQVHWSTVVLDESQAIKNASTQRAQAARRLVADARFALTGTPVENHLGDLHSLMSFLNPGLLGSARSFQERFGKPIQRDGDPRAAADLKALIAPFLLRRRKSEVLKELPARTEITLRVEPEAKEQAFVEALRRDALQRLASAGPDGQSPVTILAEITRMRRAACHPTLADPQAGLGVGSAKLDRLMLLLHDLKEEGHRALVFSQFVGFLELARERLSAEGLSYQYLDGRTSEPARRKAVRAFQSGEGDAFLISLKAGGFGLNLTAADYVIHVDPWWNPAVEAQASDRAHRIGQVRPVTVYRLVNAASIEERVLALHGRKKELAEELLQNTDQPTRLDSAALMSLLGGEDDAPARGAASNGRAEMPHR